MSDATAITVRNVSKRYHVFENQRARLRHAFWPKSTVGVSETWALRDVSFEVKKGESVGIIGRNGSGKSTLLEIITGTLQPTAGSVQVNGRIAALLELGSGFNPEYTGRENVFLNGLLLGLSRAEVENRFDDIASFADIGDVLDRLVKTYSSGMLVRLAFAVQVALEPDILIVDEALSVGDYFFQQKCFGRLRQMREDGLTLLFVSHDTGTVRDICHRAVYLEQGRPSFIGDSGVAIRHYLAKGTTHLPETDNQYLSSVNEVVKFVKEISEYAAWYRAPTEQDRLLAVHVLDNSGIHIDSASIGTDILIKVYYRSLSGDVGTTVTISVKNRYDQVIYATTANRLGIESCDAISEQYAVFIFIIPLIVEAGLYSIKIGINKPSLPNRDIGLDTTDWFGPIRVDWDYETRVAPFLGMFGLPVSGRLVQCETDYDQ